MDFDLLYNIVKNKSLILKKPHLWQDPYENIIVKCFNNEEYYTKVIDTFRQHNKNSTNEDLNLFLLSVYILTNRAYCICFTDERNNCDSDAMWRSYAYNNQSVRVKFNVEKLFSEMFSYKNDDYSMSLTKMQYSDKVKIESITHDTSNEQIDTYIGLFNKKRKTFSYEKEWRLIGTPQNNIYLLKDLIKSSLHKNLEKFDDFKNNVSIPNSDDFIEYKIDLNSIEGVLLIPHAKESVEYTVENFCNDKSINYEGKSKLYTFE